MSGIARPVPCVHVCMYAHATTRSAEVSTRARERQVEEDERWTEQTWFFGLWTFSHLGFLSWPKRSGHPTFPPPPKAMMRRQRKFSQKKVFPTHHCFGGRGGA